MAIVPLPDADAARAMIKPLVSFYIGGMGTYYHALFCRYGFEENANLVRDPYNAGDRKQAAAAVSDEPIESSCPGSLQRAEMFLASRRAALRGGGEVVFAESDGGAEDGVPELRDAPTARAGNPRDQAASPVSADTRLRRLDARSHRTTAPLPKRTGEARP
jgi:hypothetical protein